MRLQKIDDLTRPDHYRLRANDEVYFLRERTPGDFRVGETNQLIANLKIEPGLRVSNPKRYWHKTRAIAQCARELAAAINLDGLRSATLVPIPPSEAPDPGYDDRLLLVLRTIPAPFVLDIRELVMQRESIRAAHASAGNRPSVDELYANYVVVEALSNPEPTTIVVFDDVLTAGSHYRAMHRRLSERFPRARIVALFIARQKRDPATATDLGSEAF